MVGEPLVILFVALLAFASVFLYYIYRIAENDWKIDLKRWNLIYQFRQGRRDSEDRS